MLLRRGLHNHWYSLTLDLVHLVANADRHTLTLCTNANVSGDVRVPILRLWRAGVTFD